MYLNEDTLAYLSGETFSNGAPIEWTYDDDDKRFRSRIAWLRELCAARQIVHVGCVDHDLDQALHKLKRGKWVHAELCAVARRCLGVDLNAEGIEKVRTTMGFKDVLAADLMHDPCEPLFGQSWHDLLLGEVLEHIGNPVSFLTRLHERFAHRFERIIITVPNAFDEESYRCARWGSEAINTDHRFWFTPYTLAKVALDAGWQPRRLIACRNGVVKKRSVIKNRRLSRYPLLRNNLIMIAEPTLQTKNQ